MLRWSQQNNHCKHVYMGFVVCLGVGHSVMIYAAFKRMGTGLAIQVIASRAHSGVPWNSGGPGTDALIGNSNDEPLGALESSFNQLHLSFN